MTPATIVTAFAAALAPLYNWLLVDYFEIGLVGAALANDAVQACALLLPVCFADLRACSRCALVCHFQGA